MLVFTRTSRIACRLTECPSPVNGVEPKSGVTADVKFAQPVVIINDFGSYDWT